MSDVVLPRSLTIGDVLLGYKEEARRLTAEEEVKQEEYCGSRIKTAFKEVRQRPITPKNNGGTKKETNKHTSVKVAEGRNLTLYKAIEGGDVDGIKALLAAGADVNALVLDFGWNALHAAAAEGDGEIVEVLVEAGADVNAWSRSGYTALELATAQRHSNVVTILSKAGAFPADMNEESMPHNHEWTMEWQAREYLATEFSLQDDVDDILVLYSDSSFNANVACATLRAFLLRSGGSTQLVDGVVKSLLSLTREILDTTHQQLQVAIPGASLWFELLPLHLRREKAQQIRVQIRAQNPETISLLESHLMSLCCTLRPPGAQITWSDARIETLSDHSSAIILKPLESLEDCGCWAALFGRKVVVQCTLERHNDALISQLPPAERMLEAPLAWFSELAGADTPIYLDEGLQDTGGLCLSGAYSLLIPLDLHHSSSGKTTLVWHLLTIEEDADREPRSRQQLLMNFRECMSDGDWYKTERLEDLYEVNVHLLGWTPKAKITLGAPDQIYRIRRTRWETVGSRPVEPTINAGLSIGSAGSGAMVGVSFKIGQRERSIHMDKDRSLKEWLLSSHKRHILLWNPELAQGWVVPEASVVLHMTIAFLRSRTNQHGDYSELPEELSKLYHKPDRCWWMALLVLEASLGDRLDSFGLDMTIGNVVRDLLTMLGQMYIANFPLGFSRRFLGFEISDLLDRPPNFRIRQDDASLHRFSLGTLAGWHKLLPEMSAVLFFKDIKDPIVSIAHNEAKVPMQGLTKGCNHLAMMVSSLLELLSKYDDSDESDGQLADDAYWHCESLFGHRNTRDIPREVCDGLQVVASKPHPAGVPVQRLVTNLYGAVIFRANTGLLERANGEIYNDKDSTLLTKLSSVHKHFHQMRA